MPVTPWGRVGRLTVVIAVVVLNALPSRAEPAVHMSLPATTHFRLSNGLNVVLERIPEQPLVAVVVAYEAGSAHDPPGHAGLAHLVEHLTFRGSRHLPRQGIFEQLEAVGSTRWNGTTGEDLASYYAVVPAEHFALPLWIESERMAFTLEAFNQQSLEIERMRVKKELLQRGWVNLNFNLFINHALYAEGHPYRRSTDEIQDVLAAELADAVWFFQTHYRPDNAYLIVVGGFPTRTPALIRKYFGPIANPPGVPPRPRVAQRVFAVRETLTVRQPVYVDNQLVMIFPAPDLVSDDAPAFELLATLLDGTGKWSLDAAVAGAGGLAESIGIEVKRADLGSYAWITAQVRSGVPIERAEGAIEGHLASLAGFDGANDLRDARALLAGSALVRRGDPLATAVAHLEHLRASGRPMTLSAEFARQRRVEPRHVANVARRFFDPRRRLAAHLLKGGQGCYEGCVSHEVEGR